MNGLQIDVPSTVISGGCGTGGERDAVIVWKEETSDSNPWENVDHNVSLPHGDAGQPLRRFLSLSVRLNPFSELKYASRRWFTAKTAEE